MRARDAVAAAVFLIVVSLLLWWFGSDVRQVRVLRPAPIPEEPMHRDEKPLTPQPTPAACCKPACKRPDKCDASSCTCTRNAVKDAGAVFMQVYDPGPLEPGEFPPEEP